MALRAPPRHFYRMTGHQEVPSNEIADYYALQVGLSKEDKNVPGRALRILSQQKKCQAAKLFFYCVQKCQRTWKKFYKGVAISPFISHATASRCLLDLLKVPVRCFNFTHISWRPVHGGAGATHQNRHSLVRNSVFYPFMKRVYSSGLVSLSLHHDR